MVLTLYPIDRLWRQVAMRFAAACVAVAALGCAEPSPSRPAGGGAAASFRPATTTGAVPTGVSEAAVCGNGRVESRERCDDGNGDNGDACPDGPGGTCQPARCGDGFLRRDIADRGAAGFEACDLGRQNSDSAPDRCRSDCRKPRCGDGVADEADDCDLAVRSPLGYPTRLAPTADGGLWVTDATAGSAFYYDSGGVLRRQLKGLDKPLGIAVDASGRLYVGNDGRDDVEVFSARGERVQVVGAGTLSKPNDLALGVRGWLYVVDSEAGCVAVFDGRGTRTQTLAIGGVARRTFPVSLALKLELGASGQVSGEIFVAVQGLAEIWVFSADGALLRTFGGRPSGATDWEGRFVRLQALALDPAGRLHALDAFSKVVQVLSPLDGRWLADYSPAPAPAGLLLDIAIGAEGVLVANPGQHRIERVEPPAAP